MEAIWMQGKQETRYILWAKTDLQTFETFQFSVCHSLTKSSWTTFELQWCKCLLNVKHNATTAKTQERHCVNSKMLPKTLFKKHNAHHVKYDFYSWESLHWMEFTLWQCIWNGKLRRQPFKLNGPNVQHSTPTSLEQ